MSGGVANPLNHGLLLSNDVCQDKVQKVPLCEFTYDLLTSSACLSPQNDLAAASLYLLWNICLTRQ